MTPDAVGKVNERLKELMPGQEPKLTVYSVQMVDLYSSSRKFRDEVMIGGLITLIISLIGLIGYTNDEVNRRRKEFGHPQSERGYDEGYSTDILERRPSYRPPCDFIRMRHILFCRETLAAAVCGKDTS